MAASAKYHSIQWLLKAVSLASVGIICAGAMLTPPAFAGNTTYQYDTLGRVTKVTYPDNKQICYAYDPAGNRTQVKRQATGTCTPPAITLTTSALIASSPVEMSVAENAAEAIIADTTVEPSQETAAPDADSAAASF